MSDPLGGVDPDVIRTKIASLRAENEQEWAIAEALTEIADDRYRRADRLEAEAGGLEKILRNAGFDSEPTS